MAEPAGDGLDRFHGLPCQTLTLPGGDSLRVLWHGAHVVSWIAGGRERLYLSPRSRFDGQSAIRGGAPVCFPQFNQRGPLPKHGFARHLTWQADAAQAAPDLAQLTLRLPASAATRQFWPQAFEATLTLALRPGSLQLTLGVRNTDSVPLAFTGALHTYLAVADIAAVQLAGLEGQPEWDALSDRQARATGPLRFDGEFDRVYAAQRSRCFCRTAKSGSPSSKAPAGPRPWSGTRGPRRAPRWPICRRTATRTCCAWKRPRSCSRSPCPPGPNGRAGSA